MSSSAGISAAKRRRGVSNANQPPPPVPPPQQRRSAPTVVQILEDHEKRLRQIEGEDVEQIAEKLSGEFKQRDELMVDLTSQITEIRQNLTQTRRELRELKELIVNAAFGKTQQQNTTNSGSNDDSDE